MSPDSRKDLGILGEELAAAHLRDRGYVILARRHRSRYGEIDIIADDAGCVVFVEVKLRTTDLFGEAFEAIPSWKRRRIISLALDYLASNGLLDRPVRFAVAAIDERAGALEVEIIDDAFGEDG
ncbi:MAG: YraN family protein [Acidobacteriota bacterium]|nr:YraN family protein [Acidobacteriota bacterium]